MSANPSLWSANPLPKCQLNSLSWNLQSLNTGKIIYKFKYCVNFKISFFLIFSVKMKGMRKIYLEAKLRITPKFNFNPGKKKFLQDPALLDLMMFFPQHHWKNSNVKAVISLMMQSKIKLPLAFWRVNLPLFVGIVPGGLRGNLAPIILYLMKHETNQNQPIDTLGY